MANLRDVFASPADLLRLEPEELAGVLLEIIRSFERNRIFGWQQISNDAFEAAGATWDRNQKAAVDLALAEATNWLIVQGLVMKDPGQSGDFWLRLTRRGQALQSREDLESYRMGGILSLGLLQPRLAEKVHHLFVRGDHDTAVFQAFKEVEVAVRTAGGYPNDLLGRNLMQKAFAVKDGPLTNPDLVEAEREAEFFLFAGAIGHAKNPTSHRDVNLAREEAARLIVFASHLLAIVEERIARRSE